MARFTIELPGNRKGDIWRLDMINVQISDHYTVNPIKHESSSEPTYKFKAFKYEVTISDDECNAEYSLFKFGNGEWFTDQEGKIQIDDIELLAIKNAIIDREKELNIT